MKQCDASHITGLLPETRSRLDVDEPGAWHSAVTPGPDLLVQGPGRRRPTGLTASRLEGTPERMVAEER